MKLFQTTPTTLLALCLSCAFTITLSVQAASFDCAKAQSKIEHLICDSAEILRLDDELNAAYRVALQDKQQAETIKQAQRRWLQIRNACTDGVCVKDAYLTRLFSLQQIALIADATLLMTGHAEFSNEADKLKFMRSIVGQHEFPPPDWIPYSNFCKQFLKDFGASNDLVQAVEPDVKTNDKQDPRLDKWHRCENSEQKAEDEHEYRFLNWLGGPSYRYYRIDLDGNAKNGKEDVIYTETYKPGTHWAGTGHTGYAWIDLETCTGKGGAPIDAQYPPKPLPPDIYHLNTVVKYRGNYLAVDLFPIGIAYNLRASPFDTPNGRLCSWHQQEHPSPQK